MTGKQGKGKMPNKKALSPLVATMLLVVFALIVGTATMSWGKSYVENIPNEDNTVSAGSSYVISVADVRDDPIKVIQIRYILGEITLEEYLKEEEKLLG